VPNLDEFIDVSLIDKFLVNRQEVLPFALLIEVEHQEVSKVGVFQYLKSEVDFCKLQLERRILIQRHMNCKVVLD
jgi:hypothetical protein